MKPRLLGLVCCPICRGQLAIRAFRDGPEGEVEEGLLICRACDRPYPVARGVPRLLPNAYTREVGFRRDFSAELAELSFRRPSRGEIRSFERLHRLTARAFGYEWNTYRTTSREEDVLTYYWLTGLDPRLYDKLPLTDVFSYYPTPQEVSSIDASVLRGAVVLDVGCGMGKYLKVVSEHARDVVGLDLSSALDRARRETIDQHNVHLVQGNILSPPLREGAFDVAYSVGVLHHTPDAHQAFLRTAAMVRPGGSLAVWLYPKDPTPGRYASLVHWIQDDLIRPVTCRLPAPLLRFLCAGLGRLTFLRDRFAERHRQTGSRAAYYVAMAAGALAVGRHKDPEIAAFLNFDWYSPQYRSYHSEEELRRWYEEAGYGPVRLLPQRVSALGCRQTAP